jgi:hypothetical protein
MRDEAIDDTAVGWHREGRRELLSVVAEMNRIRRISHPAARLAESADDHTLGLALSWPFRLVPALKGALPHLELLL